MSKTRSTTVRVIIGVISVVFLFTWVNIQATKIGYSIERVRNEIKELEDSNNYLKKEMRLAMSPEKLQAEALKLGLVYPDPGALVLLDGVGINNKQKNGLSGLFARLLHKDNSAG